MNTMKNVVPKAGSVWSHIITKRKYEIITVSNLNAEKQGWVPTVVYLDSSGDVWSRPIKDFLERME